LDSLKQDLFPIAYLVTPNIPEAEKLCGMGSIRNVDDMTAAAKLIHQMGCHYVLVKGTYDCQ